MVRHLINSSYGKVYEAPAAHGHLGRTSQMRVRGTALLTCMDLSPTMFGHLFHADDGPLFAVANAAGVATSGALLSLSLALGQVQRIVVVQHTDCEALPFTDCAQRLQIDREHGVELDFCAIGGVMETVKDTVRAMRQFPSIDHLVEIQGYVYHGGETILVCF